MATIYRARDAQLDRDVAVKLLRPEFGQDPDFLARFRDEATAAASLSHPNIVAVFDFGEDAVRPVHRDGADRRAGPGARSSARTAPLAAAPGRARLRRGREGAPRGPRPRDRPPRRQAVEHPRRPRRPGEGRGLRHRPGARRVAADAAGHDDGLRPLLQPRAGARRARDRRRPTSTRWASSCTSRSPASGRSPATGPPPSRSPA